MGRLGLAVIGVLAIGLSGGAVDGAPTVVGLGGGSCVELAAGDEVFIDGAIAACESELAADPQSTEIQISLARAYILAGRLDEAMPLLEAARAAGSAVAAYMLARWSEDPLPYLEQAAAGGYAPAQADLAERYDTGNGVAGDYAEAKRLFELAAAQDFGLAVYRLGVYAHYGYVEAADYDRAAELYERAAELGEPLGYYGLGQMFEFGNGVAQDRDEALRYYELGAEAGEKMSQTALAYFYEQGVGVAQDYDRSFALLTAASAQDWGFAHAALAIHYLFGQGTPVDEEKAFNLAWMAQRQGVTYANGILGYMYQNGLGTVRSLSQAQSRYEDGANSGDEYSSSQLPIIAAELACGDAAGSRYEPGNVGYGRPFLDIDPEIAIPACEDAVEMNPAPVGNRVWLARAYARAERFEEAVPLLEEGVSEGNVLAHTVLGDLLMAGAGVAQDNARAIELYRAVAGDFGLAQFSLGMAYKDGLGVAEDRTEALRWLRLAESFGVEEAIPEISTLLAGGDGEADAIDLTGFGREGPAY